MKTKTVVIPRSPSLVILSPAALSEAKGLLFLACLRAGSAKDLLFF